MACECKPCREVTYSFGGLLLKILKKEGENCPDTPDAEGLQQIEQWIQDRLKTIFKDCQLECPDGCICEFDSKTTTAFKRSFNGKAPVSSKQDMVVNPAETCWYSFTATVTITRTTWTGACEPTSETVEKGLSK